MKFSFNPIDHAFVPLWNPRIRMLAKRIIPPRFHFILRRTFESVALRRIQYDVECFERILSDRDQLDAIPGRVVMACGSLQPGGAERQVVNTLAGLARLEHQDLHLLCDYLHRSNRQQYDFYLPQARTTGANVRTVQTRLYRQRPRSQLPRGFRDNSALLHPSLAVDIANLYWEFRESRPSVVHAWLDWTNIRAGIAAILAGVPRVILSGRNLGPQHFAFYAPYMGPAYKALCQLPNVQMINNSYAGAADYAAWLGLDAKNIRVIYNGIDFPHIKHAKDTGNIQFRRELGIPDVAPLIGGMFRFSPEKQPLLWIQVAARVVQMMPDTHFVLFGEGNLRSRMERLVRELGIADRVSMPGVTSSSLSAIGMMDAMLLTSYGEGTPNVALEAQWMGVPVITTNAGGAAEAIAHGQTGWVIDTPDAEKIAERVLATIADGDFRREVQVHGPQFVSERFGLDRMVAETLQAYGLSASALHFQSS